MRITEEQDRRQREAQTLERLPRSLENLHGALTKCVEAYQRAFGTEAAEIHLRGPLIEITVRQNDGGGPHEPATVRIALLPELPGFRIERGDEAMLIEVGLLPGDKLYYCAGDQFLTMEELTRRILDRVLFPKLKQE